MATSFVLAGAGMASAAAPALKIKNGAIWTLEVKNGPCEHDLFNTPNTHTFVADNGLSGTWSGGGSNISMVWNGSTQMFKGHYVSTTTPVEYKGSVNTGSNVFKAKLVKGAVAGC